MVEPAARRPSQFLSILRDQFIASGLVEDSPSAIWGPCLHSGRCPLAGGRDWCHFSVPARIPGNWFREFSKGLSSERQWVKFSYMWIASSDHPAPIPDSQIRRVISDPLTRDLQAASGAGNVLICEPETASRHPVNPGQPLWRGDLVRLGGGIAGVRNDNRTKRGQR